MNLAELNEVEIFKPGTYYGHTYTEKDMEALAENTNKLIGGGKHRAPVKLGHDEDQQFAKEAGLPALGWVRRLYVKGKRLVADFADVPEQLIKAISKKLYDSVSSEIYLDETAEAEFGLKGPVLRAVALLGADIPKVKGLKPLSASLFNESMKGKAIAVELDDNDGDEDDSPLMVPANRHPFGALVKHKDSKDPLVVHSVHPDGTYDVHDLHNPMGPTMKAVPHGDLHLMSEKGEENPGTPKAGAGATPKPDEKEESVAKEEAEALRLAEEGKAQALKLAEENAKKVEQLENEKRDAKVAAFAEKHKRFIIPAIEPSFKAMATLKAGTVKLGESEKSYLDAMLEFCESLIEAKVVALGETTDRSGEEKEMTDAEVKLAEKPFKDHAKAPGYSLTNADLAVEAEKIMHRDHVSYSEAVRKAAALRQIADEEAGK